jgi:hypothetical protein
MTQGSGPPNRPPRAALDAAASSRDPYRSPPHAQVAPGAFPAPGQEAPAPAWRPPVPASPAQESVPPKRRLVVSRPSLQSPAPGLLAQGFETTLVYGDAAGEHLMMGRGSHDASLYVAVAFVAEVLLLGCVPGYLFGALAHLAGMGGAGTMFVMVVFTLVGGSVPAWLIFRDRWCCIEAFASRYCVGMFRVSLMYVPLIALVYANVRGVKKLSGK